MKKFIIIAIILITAGALLYALIFYNKNGNKKICFDNTCLEVEISDTSEKRAQGLMYRNYLAPNKGMFFIFEKENIYPFWMKNTLIPLDIIWLDENLKVVYIKHNALPCETEVCPSIAPGKAAQYVLEINGGQAHEKNIKINEKAYLK